MTISVIQKNQRRCLLWVASHEPRGLYRCRGLSTSEAQTEVTREDLVKEAAIMTKSLYRSCLRSIKVIRWGNIFDDKEFEQREQDFLKPAGPGGAISMVPPPDKEDELRSRAEYYHSFTREYFTQESDCLDNDPLREKDIRRYLYYLRKGEKDRTWLLADMMFPDPFKAVFDHERAQRWEQMSKRYLAEDNEEEEDVVDGDDIKLPDNYFGEEEEDPDWFKKKFPSMK